MKNKLYILFYILICICNFVNSMNIISTKKIQFRTIPLNRFIEYNCPKCDKAFSTPQGLRNHQKQHVENEPSDLYPHEQMYQKKGTYACDECGKNFTTCNGLKIHKRGHLEKKPYPCPKCPEQFIQKSHLVYHIRKHNNDKPFKCDSCDKRFYTQYARSSHEKIHETKRHVHDVPHKKFLIQREPDPNIEEYFPITSLLNMSTEHPGNELSPDWIENL